VSEWIDAIVLVGLVKTGYGFVGIHVFECILYSGRVDQHMVISYTHLLSHIL